MDRKWLFTFIIIGGLGLLAIYRIFTGYVIRGSIDLALAIIIIIVGIKRVRAGN